MKRIIYSLTVLCLVFSVFSCTKDDSKTKHKRILMVDDDRYEYNSNGKIYKYSCSDWDETYTYSGNTITNTTTSTIVSPSTCVYKLNSNGYATTSTTTSEGYPKNPPFNISYEYDNAGHLIKKVDHFYNAFYTYEYIGGNLITETYSYIKDNKTVVLLTTRYEYFLDRENTLSNEYFGKGFLGKSSKNLLKKIVDSEDDVDWVYSYEYDQENYVINMTKTHGRHIESNSIVWGTI